MKTHKYILAGCCLLLLGATASCEKDLDLYSQDVISEPVYLRVQKTLNVMQTNSITVCPPSMQMMICLT